MGEIKFCFREDAGLDGLGVGALLGCGELIKKAGKRFGRDSADMLDGAEGAIGPLGEFSRKEIWASEKVGVSDLGLAHLVKVGGSDPSAGGAARFFGENLGAIIFPSEIEQAVGEIGDHRAFVDDEAGENGVTFLLKRAGFPSKFAGIGHDATANAEVRGITHNDASRQEV